MEKRTTKSKLNLLNWVFMMTLLSSHCFGQVPSDLLNQWNSNTVEGTTYDHCKQWKITYPTGDEDKTLCGEANNEFYYVNSKGDGIVFKAPIRSNNGTTPNSNNIRSELRERTIDGGSDVYWTTEGSHVIYVKQAITHLPINKDELVATQIHGNKAAGIDDALVLRLNGSKLFLSFNGNKLRPDLTIKTDYTLGTVHEVIFEVIDDKHYVYYSEDGNLKSAFQNGNASQYYVKDNGNEVLMDRAYGESYFKVGNYTQSNPDQEGSDTDNPNNYGEVVVYDMFVEHGSSDVIIVEGCVAATPSNIAVGTIGETNATLNWTFDAEQNHYNVRFRPVGSDTWTTLTSLRESEDDFTVSGTKASFQISGLIANTVYEWQIRAKCTDGSANEYTDGQGPNFRTSGGTTETCSTIAPSDILPDLKHFKVTFPVDANGNDYEGVAYADRENPDIRATEVDNLVDWVPTSQYCKYFYAEGNEVVFVAHVAGALTSANAYPRTELRETPNGTDNLWSYQDEHELNATFRITHLPNIKKEVNVLQLKGNTSNTTSGTKEPFRLDYRADGDQGLHITVNESTTVEDIMDYTLGQTIVSRMYVNNGDITIELDNIDVSGARGRFDTTYTSDYAYGYFKAGCYTQSSIWSEKTGKAAEDPSAYGEVRFSQLVLGPLGVITSNESYNLDTQIMVSPNPTKNKVTVHNSQGTTLSVYNINGVLLSRNSITENSEVINLYELTSGVYLLKFSGRDETIIRRLVIE